VNDDRLLPAEQLLTRLPDSGAADSYWDVDPPTKGDPFYNMRNNSGSSDFLFHFDTSACPARATDQFATSTGIIPSSDVGVTASLIRSSDRRESAALDSSALLVSAGFQSSQTSNESQNLTLSEFAFGCDPSWALDASDVAALSADINYSVSLQSALFCHSESFRRSLCLSPSLSLSCSNDDFTSDIHDSFVLLLSSNFQPSAFVATPENSHSKGRDDSVVIVETSNIIPSGFVASSTEVSFHFHPSLRFKPSFRAENADRSYESPFVSGTATDDDSRSDSSAGVNSYLIIILVTVALLLAGVVTLFLWRKRAKRRRENEVGNAEDSTLASDRSCWIECIPGT
jgi:hypothetical protein